MCSKLLVLAVVLSGSCAPPGARLVRSAYDGDNAGVVEGLRGREVALDTEVEFGTHIHMTALTAAATRGRVEIVRLLLDAGANPNATGRSPLHGATENRHVEVVRLLLARGADARHVDRDQRGALYYLLQGPCDRSQEKDLLTIAELLLAAGADPDRPTAHGDHPLIQAVECKNQRLVADMLARGAKVGSRGRRRGSAARDLTPPLHVATALGDVGMMRFLIEAGANIRARDHAGNTPCRIATGSWKGTIADPRRSVLAAAGDTCADDGGRANRRLQAEAARVSRELAQPLAGAGQRPDRAGAPASPVAQCPKGLSSEYTSWLEKWDRLVVQLETVQAKMGALRRNQPGVQTESVERQSIYRSSDDARRGRLGSTVVVGERRETGASKGARAGHDFEVNQLEEEEDKLLRQLRQLPEAPAPCRW